MTSKPAANESRFLFKAAGISFLVVEFIAQEKISKLFHVRLKLASEEEIDFAKVVGQPGLLTILGNDQERYFHGIVGEFALVGVEGRFYRYEALLVPQMKLLMLRSDCRIFQRQTVPAIVKAVLEQAAIPGDLYQFKLTAAYPERDYCVQYRETDWRFVTRLCAEEGIFFFFKHQPDKHIMAFGDGTVNYAPIAGQAQVELNQGGQLAGEEETLLAFDSCRNVTSNACALTDFCFEKPALNLAAGQKSADDCQCLEYYDFPGAYAAPEQGRRLAQIRFQEAVQEKKIAQGRGGVARFMPGFTFTLQDHGHPRAGEKHVLLAVRHQGAQPQVLAELGAGQGTSYINCFQAAPADVVFRPALLLKPVVHGVQTAMVTGPAHEEIYTDRHGRVKVQFHWDRVGKHNEQSSCWVRVSQPWAGGSYGGVNIPRIGQEVIVDFLEGDPDRPIITGRVYNGDNLPPYDLPAQKTISALKTLSTPGGQGFNELRFDDRKDAEQIFLHAQRNMDLRVKHDRRTWIGHDAHLVVQKEVCEQVGGDLHRTVQGEWVGQIQGQRSQSVGRDLQEHISANCALSAAKTITVKSGTQVIIEAGQTITLKAGAGFITIDSSGVSVSGPALKLKAGGSAIAGQSIAAQAPAIPLESDTGRPGKVEANPAVALPKPAPVEVLPSPTAPAANESAWIEVQLLDDQDQPKAGEQFYITAANGKQYSGVTNAQGIGRVEKLPPGMCRLDFARLDKDLWGPKGSTAIGKPSQRGNATKAYKVQPGDTLSEIAHKHHLPWRLVWEHPANADLRKKRKEPHILMIGDTVHLPQAEYKQEQGATLQRHVFQTKGEPLKDSLLRIDYQFDVDNPAAWDDVITLIHKDSDWKQTIAVKNLKEFDVNWVALIFKNVPRTGKFDLIHDTHDGEDPHYLRSNCTFEQLCAPDMDYEDIKIAADDVETA
ncbi:MAG: type VI secretion system tip protein TssI/VgrG [Desulfobacteraceae bacterium]|nr:type VI secretion system tip protein TssI/VgrG [Desulfobacteraceae bacterium]